MKKDALILFLKYPERGKVKTRLADLLGEDVTCELYRCFLADIATMIRDVRAEKMIVYAGDAGLSFPDFPDIPCLQQRGSNIGERMNNAFADVFSFGYERCVLIGSDSPDLPARLIDDAFKKLSSADVVLGPSADGGYYLIGCQCSSLYSSLFSDIPWSTARVLSATLRQIDSSGLTYEKLEQWSDIDNLDDLKIFYQRNLHDRTESKTMQYLNGAQNVLKRLSIT